MKKNFILAFVFICIALAFYIYNIYNKQHINLQEIKADFVVNPEVWIKEFETDEVKALNDYLNKIIELQGLLLDIQNIENKVIWTISTGNELSNIQCEMDERFIGKIQNKFKIGDLVKVQGICSGKLMDIVLNQVVCLN